MYERGLPYSYFAWITGTLLGQNLFSYRVTSLIFGLVSILLLFLLGKAMKVDSIFSAILVTFAFWPVMMSEWARFYSAFIAFYLLTLLLFHISIENKTRQVYSLIALGITALLLETGVTLVLFPLFRYLTLSREDARKKTAGHLFLKSLVTLALLQALRSLMFWIVPGWSSDPSKGYFHFYTARAFSLPPLFHFSSAAAAGLLSGGVLIAGILFLASRRIRMPHPIWLISTFLLAMTFQLGLIAILIFLAILLLNENQKPYWIYGVLLCISSFLMWITLISFATAVRFTPGLAGSLFVYGISYPFDALRYFAHLWPATSVLVFAVLLVFLWKRELFSAQPAIGSLLGLILCGFLILGTLNIGLTQRYFNFLFPLAFLILAGVAPVWNALFENKYAVARYAFLALVAVIVLAEQQASAQPSSLFQTQKVSFQEIHFRTFDTCAWESLAGEIRPGDTIICNDELACHYLLGRCDYWLLAEFPEAGRYSVRSASGRSGWYAGSRILTNLNEVKKVTNENGACWLLLMKTGKFETVANASAILDEFPDARLTKSNADMQVYRIGL